MKAKVVSKNSTMNPRGTEPLLYPNTVTPKLCSPKHIGSKKDQQPLEMPLVGWITPIYFPIPLVTNNKNYFKLIIQKILS